MNEGSFRGVGASNSKRILVHERWTTAEVRVGLSELFCAVLTRMCTGDCTCASCVWHQRQSIILLSGGGADAEQQ